MTLEEFSQLAQVWGADIARWPPARRLDAEAVAQSREGAAILATLDPLDRLIAAAAPRVAPERADRAIYGVVARLAQDRPRSTLAELLSRWFAPATALAGALAIGALVALVEPIIVNQQGDDLSSVLTMIFDVNISDQGPFAL